MRKFSKSIQFKITYTTVLFSFLVTVFLSTLCFLFFQNYAQKNIIKSTELNLQLVSNLIRQDVININALSNDYATNDTLISYLTVPSPQDKKMAIDTFNFVRFQYIANRSASTYVQRLIITDYKERILQMGNTVINGIPLTKYTLLKLPMMEYSSDYLWRTVTRDPLSHISLADSIPLVRPIWNAKAKKQIGSVYMTVSAKIITDRLLDYQFDPDTLLVFSTEVGDWMCSDDGKLSSMSAQFSPQKTTFSHQETALSQVHELTDLQGKKYTGVTCSLGINGLSISQYLPDSIFIQQRLLLLLAVFIIGLVVFALGLVIALYLNRTILRPVERMRHRMAMIASGNFSLDPSIEWDNEFGDIGHGINQLAQDIQALLATKISDEKEKRDLEYKMLLSQIKPHFIYNTLNSIRWMATIQNATGIAEMTTCFSRLLKSIAKGTEELIPLKEEFSLLQDYFTVQKYRYGGKINLELPSFSDSSLDTCLIPRFTLQPIVENAIFHGIEPQGGVGNIVIHLTQPSPAHLFFEIQDNGVGISQAALASLLKTDSNTSTKFQKIGLSNVHQRLQYAFGKEYGLSIESDFGQFTRVKIFIPCHYPQQLEEIPK